MYSERGGGKKGRRNKSTVKRQLVNAESSRREGLTELGAGSPLSPSLPWLIFPPSEAGAGTGPTSSLRGSQNLGEGHLCSRGEPGAPRICWHSHGNCLQSAGTEPCPCPSLVPPLCPPCSAPAPAAQCLCLPGELLPELAALLGGVGAKKDKSLESSRRDRSRHSEAGRPGFGTRRLRVGGAGNAGGEKRDGGRAAMLRKVSRKEKRESTGGTAGRPGSCHHLGGPVLYAPGPARHKDAALGTPGGSALCPLAPCTALEAVELLLFFPFFPPFFGSVQPFAHP